MIDTHCHIDFEEFDEDRLDVINRAKNNLDAVVNSGAGFEGNKRVLKLSKIHENFIYPSFGFHPVTSAGCSDEDVKVVQEHMIANLDDIVAIGEVGMDYFYVKDKAERARQKEIFISFVELANEYKIPLLIHGRDCERRCLNIVNEYDDIPEIIFHCFSGSMKTAKRIMDAGYYMSFSTMICYSQRHQELAKDIPLEYMLTETDSPYLAMTKEERNEPANVLKAGHKIAEVKGIDFETVNEITTNNAKKVFRI